MSDPHVQHAQSVLRAMEEQVAARLTAAQQHAPNSKPILRLYRTLHDLFAQSEVYALDGDDARCYMMLSTTMRYYLSIIKKHPAFSEKIVAADKAKAQALCEKIMTRMERMRAELMQQYERESREADRDAIREAQQREEMAREQAEREQAAALAATFAPTSPSPTPPAVAVAALALTALPPLQPPILPLAAVSSDLPVAAAAEAVNDAPAPAADDVMPPTSGGDDAPAAVMTDGGFTPSLNPFASLSAAPPSQFAPLADDSSLDAFANMEAARIMPAKPDAELPQTDQSFVIEPDAPMMNYSAPTAGPETEASAPPPPPATSPYAATGVAVAGTAAAIGAASIVAGAASAGASLAGSAVSGVAGAGFSALSALSSSSSSAASSSSVPPSNPAATASRSSQPVAPWTAPSLAASAPPPSVPASGAAVSGYPALQQKAAAGSWPPPPPPLPAGAVASAPPVVASAGPSAAKPRQRAVPPMPTTLRPIHLPSNVLGDFYAYAKANTDANIETCGILCGHLDEEDSSAGASSSRGFRITHVLIPNQTATADTCVTTNEEDLISLQMQYDLLTLGWIHTHPSQTCFLSSVDLHTHYTYQLMLPEAIAIVLAPRFQPNQGVFHCTLPGMKALTDCARRGFHKHQEPYALYSLAPHVCWENGADKKAKFIDLRTKGPQQPQPKQPQQQPQQQPWRPPQQQPQPHMHPHPHSQPHPQPQMMHPQQMQQRPMGFPPQPMQGYPQQPPPHAHQHRPGGPPHVHR